MIFPIFTSRYDADTIAYDIQKILEKQYTPGLDKVKSYGLLDSGRIAGEFVAGRQTFFYSIDPRDGSFTYRPAGTSKQDSWSRFDAPRVKAGAKTAANKAGKTLTCTEGKTYPCGAVCRAFGKNCKADPDAESRALAQKAAAKIDVAAGTAKTKGKTARKKSPSEQAALEAGYQGRQPPTGRLKLLRKAIKAAAEPKRKGIDEIDPSTIAVDPKRFQYKITGEQTKTGSVGSLGGVKKWDENLAGIIQVWEDPNDKQLYVVNGHNRLDLARKIGVDKVTVRYLQAGSAKEARAIGALTNIAEGRGNALDAAKFFRDSGLNKDDLERKGIPMRESIANNGLALANLSDSLFNRLILGDIPESRAVAISTVVSKLPPTDQDYKTQEELLKLVEDKEKKGKNITNEVIEELAQLLTLAPTQEQEQGGLFGLLGFSPETKSLAIERATLQSQLKKRLSREARLFGTVGKTKAAQELERAGNQINAEESQKIAAVAQKALQSFQDEIKYSGKVSNLLNDATQRLADQGKLSKKEEDQLYEDILAELRKTYRF